MQFLSKLRLHIFHCLIYVKCWRIWRSVYSGNKNITELCNFQHTVTLKFKILTNFSQFNFYLFLEGEDNEHNFVISSLKKINHILKWPVLTPIWISEELVILLQKYFVFKDFYHEAILIYSVIFGLWWIGN